MYNISLVFPQGKEKALTLSYDDGVDTDIHMIQLLEKYGIKCTFNISAGMFNTEGAVRSEEQIQFRLSKKQAKELYNHPLCEVATHGYTHPRLNQLPECKIMREIIDDRYVLENIFDRIIRGHAYPCGGYSNEVADILKRAGIVYARTTQSHKTFQLPTDWFRWGATCRHREPILEELTEHFVNGNVGETEDGWLFLLWGHTYEFRQDNNWDRIESFFEKVSSNTNIWYATNLEVYDYITAWRRLVYSTDCRYVYNPTATDIWIKCLKKRTSAKKVIAVPAGKTISMEEIL